MRRIIEQVIIGILISAVVLAVLGLVLEISLMATIAIWALMVAGVAYGILQIKDYLDVIDNPDKSKPALINMVLTVVVVLAVIVVSILTLTGKIFYL